MLNVLSVCRDGSSLGVRPLTLSVKNNQIKYYSEGQ